MDPKKPANNAATRLTQVTNHLDNSSSTTTTKTRPKNKTRTKRTQPPGPPADYSDILGVISDLQTRTSTPDIKSRSYIKQKKAGKLWVRERLERLLDEGSFREIGSVSGEARWGLKQGDGNGSEEVVTGFVPSNNIQGWLDQICFVGGSMC